MAKRTSINDAEQARLVRALMDTKNWEDAKAALPDVDPRALDKGFKTYAHKKAGLKPEDTVTKAPVEPPALPPEPPVKVETKGGKPDPLK